MQYIEIAEVHTKFTSSDLKVQGVYRTKCQVLIYKILYELTSWSLQNITQTTKQ